MVAIPITVPMTVPMSIIGTTSDLDVKLQVWQLHAVPQPHGGAPQNDQPQPALLELKRPIFMSERQTASANSDDPQATTTHIRATGLPAGIKRKRLAITEKMAEEEGEEEDTHSDILDPKMIKHIMA